MSKPAKKRTPKTAAPRATARPSSSRAKAISTDDPNKASKKETKQSRVVEMLRSPAGATIDALMKATGWQQHSVRGFFAGVVQKKLGLKLNSEKVDGKRIYRVAGGSSAGATSRLPNHASA